MNQAEPKKPIQTFAAINPDEKIRMESSSGGIFSLIAEKIIRDGGVVFGARFDEEWNVIHDYTDNIEGLKAFRGSKYVQSSIGNNFIRAKEFLDDGRTVLFTGTGCQIAGLKRYLRKEYQNLISLDLICHGVPSSHIWQTYLTDEVKFKPRYINFRDKYYGWKDSSLRINNDTEIIEKFTSNKYIIIYLSNLNLRPSCYYCPTKKGKSQSDITIGDFWGIEKIDPTIDDNKGVSLVLINNEHGKSIIYEIPLFKKEESYNDALKFNPSIERSVNKPPYRDLFMFLVRNSNFTKAYKIITLRKLKFRIYRKLLSLFINKK